jgi:hypothetical protein
VDLVAVGLRVDRVAVGLRVDLVDPAVPVDRAGLVDLVVAPVAV